jgi:autotransporter-associated beta strand protein
VGIITAGATSGVSTVNQTGGDITTATRNVQLVVGNGDGDGIYNLSGGKLTSNFPSSTFGVTLGANTGRTGTFTLSGSAILDMTATSRLQIGRSDGGTATGTTGYFNQSGSSVAIVNSLRMGGASATANASTTAELNLSGGTFTAATFDALSAGNTSSSKINISGTADVTLPAFPTARGTSSTATVTFDGGTLRPAAASATYMGGLTNAFIKVGGARFNTNNGSITITQDLLTDPVSTGGGLTKEGINTVALSGTNTYTGATTISAGTLQFAKGVSLYNYNTTSWTAAKIVVGNSGTLALNVGGTGEFTTTDANTLLTNLGGANGTSTAGFAAGSKIAFDTTGGAFSFEDIIADSSGSGGGAIGLTKLGANTLTLSGNNTYSGGTSITGGIVSVTTSSTALGTNTVTFNTLNGGVRLVVDSGLDVTNAITIGDNAGASGRGLVEAGGTGTATVSGPITINNAAKAGGHFCAPAPAILHVAGAITSSVQVTSRNGTVMFSGRGTGYTDFNVQQGTVMVGVNDGLSTAATVLIGGSSTSYLDLNGFNQSLVGIVKGPNAATIGNSSTDANSILTTTGTSTFAGTIVDVIASGTRKVGLAVDANALTLTGANTFSGNITINGGKLVAAAVATGANTPLGKASNTRTITVNTGGTLEFVAPNVFNGNFSSTVAPTLAITGGTVTNANPGAIPTGLNNCLNNVTLAGGTLSATVGQTNGYGAWNINGTITSTGTSFISSGDPNYGQVMLNSTGAASVETATTIDVQSGTLTISAPLAQVTVDGKISGLTKTGVGTLVLSGANTYTGNTSVDAGTLSLAATGSLTFVIDANGVNNKITGTGTVDLAGAFNFDLTDAVVALGNTWKIVDNATLAETYQNSFSVIGFTGGQGAGVLWTKSTGGSLMWEFSESTGELCTVVPGDTNNDGVADAADYIAVKTNIGMPSGATKLQGDLDGDFDVDWDDLQQLMANFGTRSVVPAPPAPEPATLGLLAIGALALLKRKRKS